MRVSKSFAHRRKWVATGPYSEIEALLYVSTMTDQISPDVKCSILQFIERLHQGWAHFAVPFASLSEDEKTATLS